MAKRLEPGLEGPAARDAGRDELLQYRNEVHIVVRRMLADANLAEDIVQETLLRALQHEATVEPQRGAALTPTLRPAVLSPSFSQDEPHIYIGDPAQLFDAALGTSEPLGAVPPWARSYGIAPAPDHATSRAVLVGAAVSKDVNSGSRGAIFRREARQCENVQQFDDMNTAPGVCVSPKQPDLVYAWTTYVAYRSADGGRTWARQELGPVLDLIEVGERLVFLSLSGVPISDDRGATWRQLRRYSISAVAPIGRRGLLLAAGPGMACSPDGGDHWQPNCRSP